MRCSRGQASWAAVRTHCRPRDRGVGWMDHDGEQVPVGIHEDGACAAEQRFGAVKAAQAARQGLDRLALNDGGAGGGIAADMQPRQFAQLGMEARPGAVQAPVSKGAKGGVDGAPCAVLTRELAPRTATAQHGANAVDDAPHSGRPRAGAWFGNGDQASQERPRCICAIARVHWHGHPWDALRNLLHPHFG
jgi:hypothetical protein